MQGTYAAKLIAEFGAINADYSDIRQLQSGLEKLKSGMNAKYIYAWRKAGQQFVEIVI